MLKFLGLALIASATFVASAAQADTLAYNSNPTVGWYEGNNMDYLPANSAVLTTDNGSQLALRFHETFQFAPASVGDVYNFGLGTDPLSFDWSLSSTKALAADIFPSLITVDNLGNGMSFTYDPFASGNDNETISGAAQNSFRVNWANVGFDPLVNATYKVTFDVANLNGGKSLSVIAKVGTGAVPEPATWAMMIGGFGVAGGALRRSKTKTSVRFARA